MKVNEAVRSEWHLLGRFGKTQSNFLSRTATLVEGCDQYDEGKTPILPVGVLVDCSWNKQPKIFFERLRMAVEIFYTELLVVGMGVSLVSSKVRAGFMFADPKPIVYGCRVVFEDQRLVLRQSRLQRWVGHGNARNSIGTCFHVGFSDRANYGQSLRKRKFPGFDGGPV